jgi:hypothetical protein
MSEVGGQERQFALRVLIGPIPPYERAGGESVSQVVQTRAMTVGGAAQTDLPGQRVERPMNISAIQPMAPAGDEHIGGHRPLPPMTCAPAEVIGKRIAGRDVQRYQTSLAELGAADGQHRSLEIDIVKLEVAGFAEPQPLDTQEPEQTVVDPRAQRTAFIAAGHLERGAQ